MSRFPSLNKAVALTAMVVGVAGGSYGIAAAATGSGSATTATTTTPAAAPSISGSTPAPGPPPGATAGSPWGAQRGDETLLTGDALAKVTAVAQAKVSGGTIVRVETDADGNAKYEAHVVKSDGTPATVYVNDQFQVVSVESR